MTRTHNAKKAKSVAALKQVAGEPSVTGVVGLFMHALDRGLEKVRKKCTAIRNNRRTTFPGELMLDQTQFIL